MRTSRKMLSLLIVIVTIAACVAAASFVLKPYGSKSQIIWSDFRQQENIDTLCIGSSLAARSFDPAAIDEEFGTHSFNLSTPNQQPAESYLGLKEAIEHHELKSVVYGIDFGTFQHHSNLYPGRVFLNEKWKDDPFFERFGDLEYALGDSNWMFKEKSINWLFPWTEQHARPSISGLMDNVRMKLDGTSLETAAEANEKGWDYVGQGYGNYSQVVDYNKSKPTVFADRYEPRPLDKRSLADLADIIELCNDNDIDFIAIVPPMPEFSLISLQKHYSENSSALKAFVEEHGGAYYDFNLAKPELFKSEEGFYADFQHCNFAGAKATTEALVRLIKMHEAGESTDDLFCSLGERLAYIDHISIVRLKDTKENGSLKLTAEAFAGSNVEVEYRFLLKDGKTDEYSVLRDYSTDPTFEFTPPSKGQHMVKVEARVVGSDSAYDRYAEHTVYF